MEAKTVLVAKIGSDYLPPAIREVPTIADGTATVFFKSPLSQAERDSLSVCFRNFCGRRQVSPCITIRGQFVTITGETEEILRQALDFLEINKLPEPRTPVTVKKKMQTTNPVKKQPRLTGDMLSQQAGLSA